MATLSLVTPSYNQAEYVGKMLQSVAGQSVAPVQHLIFDGGSNDGSLDIIRDYAEGRENVSVEIGKDSGQTNAINLGFAAATGDIIAWLNTDDFYIDDKVIEDVTNFFDAHPDVDIVYGRGKIISHKGEFLRDAFISTNSADLQNTFMTSVGILQPALFMRRSVFEDIGALDESMSFAFDYEYWVRARFAGKRFHFLDRFICEATYHTEAKTIRHRSVSLNECIALCKKYYGFGPLEWIDRLANFELSGADGIVQNQADRTEEYLSHRDNLFDEKNADKAQILAAFNAAHFSRSRATIREFKNRAGLNFSKVIVTSGDSDSFHRTNYLVAKLRILHGRTVPVFVFDAGMNATEKASLNRIDNVFVLHIPEVVFSVSGQHAGSAGPAFRLHALRHSCHIVGNACQLLWLDPDAAPRKPLTDIFDAIRQNRTVDFALTQETDGSARVSGLKASDKNRKALDGLIANISQGSEMPAGGSFAREIEPDASLEIGAFIDNPDDSAFDPNLDFAIPGSQDIAIILGNGPSLKGFNFDELNRFDTFGMNAAYRYWEQIGWYPKYYACLDLVVGLSHSAVIKRLIEQSDSNGIKLFFLRDNLVAEIGNCRNRHRIVNFDEIRKNHRELMATPITTGSHTAAWAASLGYKQAYLLGVDCNYEEFVPGSAQKDGIELEIVEDRENPNYFFDGYQKKGDKYNIPNPIKDLHLNSWRSVASRVSPEACMIRNANFQSKIDVFDFCRFEDIQAAAPIHSIAPHFILNAETYPPESAEGIKGQKFRDARFPADTTFGTPPLKKEIQAQFDEFQFAFELLDDSAQRRILIDVGAHVGSGAFHSYAEGNWDIYAFEPDPENRNAFLVNHGFRTNVVLFPDAVSDKIGTNVDFYSSDVSTGISGLSPFHHSHEKTAQVSTTTLDSVVSLFDLDHIDCLKIDVEGHEMSVLNGLDFGRCRPEVIIAEFEDLKTKPNGYDSHHLAGFLVERGYTVYVSEWHPIVEYGRTHSWRSLKKYPCNIPGESWGNFIAFLNPPSEDWLVDAMMRCFRMSEGEQQSTEPDGAANQTDNARDPLEMPGGISAVSGQTTAEDSAYATVAQRIKARSGLAFRILQFGKRGLFGIIRRPALLVTMIAALMIPVVLIGIDPAISDLLTPRMAGLTLIALYAAGLISAFLLFYLRRRDNEIREALETQIRELQTDRQRELANLRENFRGLRKNVESSGDQSQETIYIRIGELNRQFKVLEAKFKKMEKQKD